MYLCCVHIPHSQAEAAYKFWFHSPTQIYDSAFSYRKYRICILLHNMLLQCTYNRLNESDTIPRTERMRERGHGRIDNFLFPFQDCKWVVANKNHCRCSRRPVLILAPEMALGLHRQKGAGRLASAGCRGRIWMTGRWEGKERLRGPLLACRPGYVSSPKVRIGSSSPSIVCGQPMASGVWLPLSGRIVYKCHHSEWCNTLFPNNNELYTISMYLGCIRDYSVGLHRVPGTCKGGGGSNWTGTNKANI